MDDKNPDPRDRRSLPRRRWPRRLTDKIWNVRRRNLYGLPAAALAAAALLFLWAFWLEPQRLVVNRASIALPAWPAGRPLRVAALADIHAGAPYITPAKMRSLVELTNRQKPDIVVLLGDYVILGVLGGRFMEPEEMARSIAGLRAPLGVFAVLGNHDWWYNGRRTRAALESVGYRVLEDEAAAVDWGGAKLYIAGLGDEWTRRPDAAKVLAAVPPGRPTLVLTHNPDLFPRLPPVNGIALAAHTHGGQVRLPFMGAPIVPSRYRQRYARGHVQAGGQHLFVTSGIGTSVLPVRFGVPPEIAVLSLSSKEERDVRKPADGP